MRFLSYPRNCRDSVMGRPIHSTFSSSEWFRTYVRIPTLILNTGHFIEERHFHPIEKIPNSVIHLKKKKILFFSVSFYRRLVGGRGGFLACSPHGITSCTSFVDELNSQSLFTWMTIGPGVDGDRPATR